MTRVRLLLVGLSCALSACSLFTNLSGLSNSGDEGLDGVDATAGDGSSLADHGSSNDGAPDGAGPFCKSLGTAPIFCADFDDGLQPSQIFLETDSTYGDAGVLRLDTTRSVSPPASLELSGPDVITGASASNLAFALGSRPATKSLRLELDLRVEAMSASGAVMLVALGFESTGGQSVTLAREGSSLLLKEELFSGDGGASHPLGRGLPLGVWMHIQIVLDLVQRRVHLALDGTTLVDAPSAGSSQGGPAVVVLGYSCDGSDAGLPATSVRYDNVAMFTE